MLASSLFRLFVLGLLIGGVGVARGVAEGAAAPRAKKALVRITAVRQVPDYVQPWSPGRSASGNGTGFIIEGQRILTNAHVVSNDRYIQLRREGTPRRFAARVLHAAHDCDLALLTVDDEAFFEGTSVLEFGGIPALESTVSAQGYPIGGTRMSVTRGVVSRIESRVYAHSSADAHLTVQIDAAINPGNSGGPVIQDGKVVGVAFQALQGNVAQNTGYMIPTTVVRRFLRDVEDGTYDGFVDLSISTSNLLNPARRAALGVAGDSQGVVVDTVYAQGSCDGVLEPGDVLLSIGGHPIFSDGTIRLDGMKVMMTEVVERKLKGDTVDFEVLRDGAKTDLQVTLKPSEVRPLLSRAHGQDPRYVIFGGLIFQPLDRNFMIAHNPRNLTARHYFSRYVKDQLYRERPEPVILSNLLPDQVNTYLGSFRHQLIDTINGRTVRELDDVHSALNEDVDYHLIKTLDGGRPIVLSREAAEQATARIQTRYGISSTVNLGE